MRPLLLCLLASVAVVGCGGEPERDAALPGVRLTLAAPQDAASTTESSVTVAGSVRPASARVRVDGSDADVSSAGTFSVAVPLARGVNVIDVQAGAPRRPAAMTAVRVTRQVPIEVPDVSGDDPDAAEDRLRALGFDVAVRRGGGLLDEILPGALGVCGTDPEAGDKALPGATVTLEVRKSC